MVTKLFVFKNGLQLIAREVKAEEGTVWIEKPARVITQVNKNDGRISYALEPHLPLVDGDQKIDIKTVDLLHTPLKPSSDLVDGYIRATSDIVLPSDGRSILNG